MGEKSLRPQFRHRFLRFDTKTESTICKRKTVNQNIKCLLFVRCKENIMRPGQPA